MTTRMIISLSWKRVIRVTMNLLPFQQPLFISDNLYLDGARSFSADPGSQVFDEAPDFASEEDGEEVLVHISFPPAIEDIKVSTPHMNDLHLQDSLINCSKMFVETPNHATKISWVTSAIQRHNPLRYRAFLLEKILSAFGDWHLTVMAHKKEEFP